MAKIEKLSLKALSRATLDRQMLLSRQRVKPLKVVERLVGMQAQEARPPFIGMWTRLERFAAADLIKLFHSRKVVRATSLRGTLHLMTVKDYIALRGAIQPALSAGMKSILGKRAVAMDLSRVVKDAAAFFRKSHATFKSLRDHLDKLHKTIDARSMGYAVRTHLPIVQVPTDDTWGFPNHCDFALAESWLAEEIDMTASDKATELLVKRYLAAFGPATAADARIWSGLSGLNDVFERLRPKLKVFVDEKERELFDLPRAPRPAGDTPAPVRLLPEFDNLILSHADRSRVISDEHRQRVVSKNLRVFATFLVDGFAAGTWKIESSKSTAKVTLTPFRHVPKQAKGELREECKQLAAFVEPGCEKVEIAFE